MERMAPDKANAHALLASMDKGAAPAAQLGWRFNGGLVRILRLKVYIQSLLTEHGMFFAKH